MKTEFESIKAEKDDLDIKEQKLYTELLFQQIQESIIKQKLLKALWLAVCIILTIVIIVILWKVCIAVGIITITESNDFMKSCIPGDFVTVLSHKAFL